MRPSQFVVVIVVVVVVVVGVVVVVVVVVVVIVDGDELSGHDCGLHIRNYGIHHTGAGAGGAASLLPPP